MENEKLEIILEKMQKKREMSIKAVEAKQQQEAHKFMLKREERQLREDDMGKVHARQKRLAMRKKNDIMRREHQDLSNFKDKRKNSMKLIEFRYRNRVQSNINSDMYSKTLDDWARKGFNTSTLAKPELDMKATFDKRHSATREYLRSAR